MTTKLPYKNLQFVSVIDEIDIPILTHYRNESGIDLLRYLVEIHNDRFISVVWRVTELELFNYLLNKRTLRELLTEPDKEFYYILTGNEININDANVDYLSYHELPENYLPDINSYYGFNIPKEYEFLTSKYGMAEYVVALNERGVVLKINPRNKKYGETVGLSNVADFTNKVTSSYFSYVNQEFYKRFKNTIQDIKEFEKAKRKVNRKAEPRVCDAEFGSFEITISIDFLNSEDLDKDVLEWLKTVLSNFADNVLYLDYSNEEVVKELVKKVSPLELKSVYEPFITALNQKEYIVNVRSIGTNKAISFNKDYRSSKKIIKKTILELDEKSIEAEKKKLVHVVYEVDANREITELKKSELKKDMIVSYEAKSFPFIISEIDRPERKYNLTNGIEFEVQIQENNMYLIEHEIFKNESILIYK